MPKKNRPPMAYMSIGFQLMATVLVAVLLGLYIDDKIGSNIPWVTILFAIIGVIGGLYMFIKNLS